MSVHSCSLSLSQVSATETGKRYDFLFGQFDIETGDRVEGLNWALDRSL